jgi:hypothetical protein
MTAAPKETLERLSFPDGYQRGPNCGVLAVAVCSGKPYADCEAALRLPGNWKGGTRQADRERVLRAFGVRFDTCANPPRRTLLHFVRCHAEPNTLYKVRVTGHVVTVLNGMVFDQRGAVPVASCISRRKIVKTVLRIKS